MWSPSFRFCHQSLICTSPLPVRTTCLAHLSYWFDHLNNIWWGAQSIKLFVLYSSPFPCYLVPSRAKYPPQHFTASLTLVFVVADKMCVTSLCDIRILYIIAFSGVMLPMRCVNHPPLSSSEVKEKVELHVYSPSGPSWPVLGWNWPSIYNIFIDYIWVKRWRSWLRHCATSRKVAGSIPHRIAGIFSDVILPVALWL
jgi:hypothetical protein